MSGVSSRPTDLSEYWRWFATNIWPTDSRPLENWDWYVSKTENLLDFPDRLWEHQENRYELKTKRLQTEFKNSTFWTKIWPELVKRNTAYLAISKDYGLLTHPATPPEVRTKPWKSFVEKSFRKNVILNRNEPWPSPPNGGWVTPENLLEKIEDVIRTTVIVKYMDGVEVVRDAILTVAEASGVSLTADEPAARLEGYYARHLTLSLQSPSGPIPVEIQVCTQVQDVLRALTHPFYVERRLDAELSLPDMLWDYKCKQFTPCFLGHILHYADGAIMNIRHRQEEERNE